MSEKVFVYGTLRAGSSSIRGGGRFGKIIHPEASVEGFDLLDLGAFPGVVPGEGVVQGEVLEVNPEVLYGTLDRIEGYNPHRPSEGLYDRRKVLVQLPTKETVEAWIYVFNQHRDVDPQRIPSGDWLAHRANRDRQFGIY